MDKGVVSFKGFTSPYGHVLISYYNGNVISSCQNWSLCHKLIVGSIGLCGIVL